MSWRWTFAALFAGEGASGGAILRRGGGDEFFGFPAVVVPGVHDRVLQPLNLAGEGGGRFGGTVAEVLRTFLVQRHAGGNGVEVDGCHVGLMSQLSQPGEAQST